MVLTNEYVWTTMNEFFIWHVQNVIKCVNSVFIWLGSRRLKLFMLCQKFQRLKDKDYLIASLNFQAVKHAIAIVFVTIFHWKTNIATLKKFQHKSNFKSTFSLTDCINYVYKNKFIVAYSNKIHLSSYMHMLILNFNQTLSYWLLQFYIEY